MISGQSRPVNTCHSIWLCLALLLSFIPWAGAQPVDHWRVASPDGKITVAVRLSKPPSGAGTELSYAVQMGRAEAIEPSPLGVTMEGGEGDFTDGLTFSRESTAVINETYTLPSGKKRLYASHANELALTFRNAAKYEVTVYFRAFNDGIAFRYTFPGNGEQRTILREASGFHIPLESKGWGQPWQRRGDHESLYRSGVVGRDFFVSDELWFPALFELPRGNGWILVTEAAVYGDYCLSRLEYTGNRFFRVKHNRTGEVEDKLISTLPWKTPWRVAILGATLAPIIESNICENLNPPSEIADMSWIKPGRTSWTWWYGPASLHDEFAKFAEEMGWEYGCERGQFYYDWIGANLKGGGDRGRLLRMGPLAHALDADFARHEADGKVLLKCDFMNSDSQERMKDYDLIARLAMQHKIMVNWHGARLPGGERRRWPNMVGCEGVLGGEYYKPEVGPHLGAPDGPTLFHRLCLPFTRNAVGPMDFTGVTFTGPATDKRRNSDAAELAIAVLYENGISYWGDHPEAYRARPAAINFLKRCPSAWEETKFIAGYPGEFVCLARQALRSDTWFLGAMSNAPAQNVSIPLRFLLAGRSYRLTLHHDGSDGSIIETENQMVSAATALTIHLVANGGFAAVLEPILSAPG